MLSSVWKASGKSHIGTLRLIIASWFSAPPYKLRLAKAPAQCLSVGTSLFLHSNSNASSPPRRITSLQVSSLCLNRCSKIPVPTREWSIVLFFVQTQATFTTLSSPCSTTCSLLSPVKHCSSNWALENCKSLSCFVQFAMIRFNPPQSRSVLQSDDPSSWP